MWLAAGVVELLSLAALLGGCATVEGLLGKKPAPVPTVADGAPKVQAPAQPAAPLRPDTVSREASREPVPSPGTPRVSSSPITAAVLPGVSRVASQGAVSSSSRAYRDVVLTEDTVWRGDVVIEGSLTVAPQTTLTLEPGTVVRFRRTTAGEDAGPLLLVQGRLVARGSAEAPVRFTSVFPDPQPGEWQGIVFLASEKKNLLEHCRIEGAVTGLDASFSAVTLRMVSFATCGTGARFQDSVVTVAGGGASGCGTGMEFVESEADVRDATLRDNRFGMVVRGGSLLLEGAAFDANSQAGLAANDTRLKIAGILVENNGDGVTLTCCEGAVMASRVAANRQNGIILARSRVKVTASEVVNNGAIGLRVEDGRGMAWGNVFMGNGRHDIFNGGVEDFRAFANWWGEGGVSPTETRLHDRHQDPERGRVLVTPVLRLRPLLATPNSVAK
ncbi:MAG: hypothetical protein ED859_14030 [Desulfuromonadales bacterium]|nr:MAG: hypothetical protein ED859_14030 [Desulfuromonadales bacterium]